MNRAKVSMNEYLKTRIHEIVVLQICI